MSRALALALLLVAGPALAGTEITIETRRAGEGAKPERSVVEVEGRKLRADAGNGRHAALWSGEAGVLEILDHRERSIVRIDRATARQVLGAREGIRGRLEGLPPAQREALDGWLGGSPPAPVELRSRNESAEVNGIRCRLLDALRGGVRLAEVCEAPLGAAGVTHEALAPARELAAFLAEVGALLPRSLGAESLDALVLAPQLKGVPLRVRAWPKDAPATESRIVGAVAKRFPAERFQAPAGYRAAW